MSKETVPKSLYDELLEKYEEVIRENERLRVEKFNVPSAPRTPTIPTLPWYYSNEPNPLIPPKIWCKEDSCQN